MPAFKFAFGRAGLRVVGPIRSLDEELELHHLDLIDEVSASTEGERQSLVDSSKVATGSLFEEGPGLRVVFHDADATDDTQRAAVRALVDWSKRTGVVLLLEPPWAQGAAGTSPPDSAAANAMTQEPVIRESSWAESAIEGACRRAEEWYRSLPTFTSRVVVGAGEVVGHRHPALLSERDCVIHFARFLHAAGVSWDAIHHEVPFSRWIFDAPHPAATKLTPGQKRRRVDLALVRSEDLLEAQLPATDPGFKFDAFLEFGYLSDYWKVPGAVLFGDPAAGRKKVADDVEKIALHLDTGACRLGYVIVFEECDWGFDRTFADETFRNNGCRVRFIRGYEPEPVPS
jgi:hypothetical protein